MSRRLLLLLLFRSKSCGVAAAAAGTCSSPLSSSSSPPNISLYHHYDDDDKCEEEEKEDEEEECTPGTMPVITTSPQQQQEEEGRGRGGGYNRQFQQQQQRQRQRAWHPNNNNNKNQFQIVVTVLRKSLVTCSTTIVEEDREDGVVEIGWPTDVKHLSHVTFDRYNGFLGLPLELQPHLPSKVPSASASVFGVSANSMQCSYDERGNSVPTILLMMQQNLYSEGGLQAEGIFRINAENGHEEYVRSQLNTGVVPLGIDVHCLAGLIKAWFRELPTGVLDSLGPEQVMHCNSEDDCTQLVKLLPPTEAALLDWAIHLMADVVHHESHNKMNAHNIAMVFAPNMTKMADPLTALIHAAQVMNLLRTLIVKILGQREEPSSCTDSRHGNNTNTIIDSQSSQALHIFSGQRTFDCRLNEGAKIKNLFRSATLNRLEPPVDFHDSVSDKKTPVMENNRVNPKNGLSRGYSDEDGGGRGEATEGIFDRLSLKKAVRKLYRHPVFQLNRPPKKSLSLAIV